jgi:hypothetical protein
MEPMTMLALGGAIAGGVSSIFGGKSQGAAIRAQNEQAMRNWVAANTQKTMNNAREQFNATYQFQQQMKRNSAIAQSAYQYQQEASEQLKYNTSLQQRDMSRALNSQSASLLNATLSKGISSSSGMYGMLAAMQALDALDKSTQLDKAIQTQKQNIDKQFNNIMSQQTENIFMPNIQGYDQAPILGDASAAERGGMISGLIQIGSAVGAAGFGAMGKSGSGVTVPETSPDFVGPPSWAAGG